MNLLMISVRADVGGGPKHLAQLLASAQATEENIFVASPSFGDFFPVFKNCVGINNFFNLPHRRFKVRVFLRLLTFCRKNHIDVIHSHGKGAGFYSRLLKFFYPKVKVVHTFHGVHIGGHSFIYRILYSAYETVMSLLTDKIIAVSDSESTDIEKLLMLSFSDKLVVIPNGVHIPDTVNKSKLFQRLTLVVVSRFDYQKNTSTLVEILTKLSNIDVIEKVFVLGKGDELHKIVSLVNGGRLSFEVDILGNVNDPDYYYSQSHAILNTSRWEGLPLSVLEAMAFGVVPVISDVIGNKDILKSTHKCGCLFPLEDTNVAISFLEEIFSNHDVFDCFSNNARTLVLEKYNEERMAASTFQYYK